MGVTDALARRAVRRGHVLVAEAPGHFVVRAAVERAVLARGWALATSPADADVLAVCGSPGPELAEAVDRVWHQMPGPRTRIDVAEPQGVATALDGAQVTLLDAAHHSRDARDRPAAADLLPEEGDDGDESEGGDEGEHEHGGMDMAPAGIPLAQGGEDRDGLEMDVLRVPLGPVLPYWPPGLVLWCALQGDVIVDADVDVVDGDPAPRPVPAEETAPRRCDALAGVLALAGWADAAAQARLARDETLTGGPSAATERLERLGRRVERSRLLRWSLRGLRPVSERDAEALGLPPTSQGDTHDRLLRLLAPDAVAPTAQVLVGAIPDLVTGLELAAARLVVASLHLHPLTAAREVDHAG